MASPQTENGHVKIANELWNEILRRDFSKRQQNLILFIWRLSYGTGQKDCIVERFNAFEIAGVYKPDIKKELKFLRDCFVLNWNEEDMIFSINKNYELWQITPNKNWDNDKFKSLIHQNIARKKVSKTLTDEKYSKPEVVSKTLTFKSKKVSKTLTPKLVKHLPRHDLILTGTRFTESLKTVVKPFFKDITTTTETRDEVSKKILDSYMKLKGQFSFSPKDEMAAKEIAEEGISSKKAIQFLEEKFQSHEKNKKHRFDKINGLNYCAGYILDRFHENKKEGKNKSPIPFKRKQSIDEGKAILDKFRRGEV